MCGARLASLPDVRGTPWARGDRKAAAGTAYIYIYSYIHIYIYIYIYFEVGLHLVC